MRQLRMQLNENPDGTILLTLTKEERETLDWMNSVSPFKFQLFLENYLMQRGIHKKADQDRQLLDKLNSLPEATRNRIKREIG